MALLALVSALAGGCGSAPDEAALFDQQVEAKIAADSRQIDAVKFFENGGRYWNVGVPNEPRIDQECLLPLLRRMEEQLGVRPQVLLKANSLGVAHALIVPLPAEEASRRALDELVLEADEQFGGLILHQMGHQWMAIDILSEEEVKHFGLDELLKDPRFTERT